MDGIQIGKKVLGIWFRPGLFAGLNKQKKKMRRNDENDLMGWAPMGLVWTKTRIKRMKMHK